MVGMAVGYQHGIGAGGIVVYPVHLGEGARAGIDMQETAVMLDQHPAGAANLEHGGVPPAASAEKCYAECHALPNDCGIYGFFRYPHP
jgi:hypothetical protein